jgi:DnaJ-class molecular chaperone
VAVGAPARAAREHLPEVFRGHALGVEEALQQLASGLAQKLRLRGRGLPGKPAAGDQIVEIEVNAPRAENEEQREAYAKLAAAFGK